MKRTIYVDDEDIMVLIREWKLFCSLGDEDIIIRIKD
jgi:hypothetical protein